jgi:hypothetical protein
MNTARHYSICPACGVPRTAFEEYRETISDRRRIILDLHLHPITVHFPQAISTLLLLLLIADIALPMDFTIPIELFVFILPLTAGMAFVTGLIDAHTRFKKLTTQFIIKKIVFGSLFIILSLLIAAGCYFFGLNSPWRYGIIAASACCVACQAFLGIIGIQLMFAKLPGK